MATQPKAGALKQAWHSIFGERDELAAEIKSLKRHGSAFRQLARLVSYLMLIGFSAQGVLAFVQKDAAKVMAELGSGTPVDWNAALTVFVVSIFTLGADLAFIACAEKIRDAAEHNRDLPVGALLLALFVGLAESLTYIKVVADTETPANAFDWFLLILRAVLLPWIVLVLASLTAKTFSPREFRHITAIKFAHAFHAMLAQLDLSQADAGEIANGYASSVDLTAAEQLQMTTLAQAATRLSPGGLKAQYESDLAEVKAATTQKIADMRGEMARQTEAADAAILDRATGAVMHLITKGELPQWLTDAKPELAGLALPSAAKARKHAPAKEPQSKADRQRQFLADLGIEPVTPPEGKNGVWLRATDLPALAIERSGSESAQDLVRRLGDGAKSGRHLVAKFDAVMAELVERHLLNDAAYMWYRRQQQSEQQAADTSDDSGLTWGNDAAQSSVM